MTSEQIHKDHIANRQRVNRHSLRTLLYFFIFSTALFFNSIFCQPTNGTFAFAPTAQADPLGKIKRAIFNHRTNNNDVLYYNSQANPDFISIKHDFLGLNRQLFLNISYHCGQE